MRKSGLVSILMPVMNGELFLPFALDSLLAQNYPLFEIIILDNQSTDRTEEICCAYAMRDGRIRYMRDSVNRITHDAANHLATFITGEFCMYACDDDIWDPNFLSVLVGRLQGDLEIGLAFPNACYVDISGDKGTRRLLSKRLLYSRTSSPLRNVWSFLWHRRVVPMLFGVYRSETLIGALPFVTFDETIANVDTLFLIKLMLQAKVQGVDEVLFYYRNKYRGYDPSVVKAHPAGRSVFAAWLFEAGHQWRFLRQIIKVLNEAHIARGQRLILLVRVLYVFVGALTILRMRSAVGKVLVQLGLREGPPRKKDIHFEIRSAALQTIGYNPLPDAIMEKELSPSGTASHKAE